MWNGITYDRYRFQKYHFCYLVQHCNTKLWESFWWGEGGSGEVFNSCGVFSHTSGSDIVYCWYCSCGWTGAHDQVSDTALPGHLPRQVQQSSHWTRYICCLCFLLSIFLFLLLQYWASSTLSFNNVNYMTTLVKPFSTTQDSNILIWMKLLDHFCANYFQVLPFLVYLGCGCMGQECKFTAWCQIQVQWIECASVKQWMEPTSTCDLCLFFFFFFNEEPLQGINCIYPRWSDCWLSSLHAVIAVPSALCIVYRVNI